MATASSVVRRADSISSTTAIYRRVFSAADEQLLRASENLASNSDSGSSVVWVGASSSRVFWSSAKRAFAASETCRAAFAFWSPSIFARFLASIKEARVVIQGNPKYICIMRVGLLCWISSPPNTETGSGSIHIAPKSQFQPCRCSIPFPLAFSAITSKDSRPSSVRKKRSIASAKPFVSWNSATTNPFPRRNLTSFPSPLSASTSRTR